MPTMRFTRLDERKVIYFDSSPANSIGRAIGCDPSRFSLRNERTKLSITTWDVFSVGLRDDEKTPLRKFGTLDYQAPEWPGGPSKPWIR